MPLASGRASLSTAGLTPGTHVITLTYSGDSNFLASSASASPILISPSIILLEPTANGALYLAGNAFINVSESGNAQIGAGLIVNTLHMSGNAGASISVLAAPVQTIMSALAQMTAENTLVSAVAQARQTADANSGAFARHSIRIHSARGTSGVRAPVVPGGPIASWRRRLGAKMFLIAGRWKYAR